MEELYKVMDDLPEVEFQMKAGMDILKELEEFYMLEKETEKSDARKVAVLMKGYLQSMKYQKLLETLSQEQEEVITEYCNAIFSSGADTEEFFYRLGLKDGLNLKNTVKSTLEMLSGNIRGGERPSSEKQEAELVRLQQTFNKMKKQN